MVKKREITLNVLMNNTLVGKFIKTKTGSFQFIYEQEWLNQPGARPISLSLPLTSNRYEGDIVSHFFENLLPDNPQIKTRIQKKFQIPSNQAFDLLSIIGEDCVGAIQISNKKTNSQH